MPKQVSSELSEEGSRYVASSIIQQVKLIYRYQHISLWLHFQSCVSYQAPAKRVVKQEAICKFILGLTLGTRSKPFKAIMDDEKYPPRESRQIGQYNRLLANYRKDIPANLCFKRILHQECRVLIPTAREIGGNNYDFSEFKGAKVLNALSKSYDAHDTYRILFVISWAR